MMVTKNTAQVVDPTCKLVLIANRIDALRYVQYREETDCRHITKEDSTRKTAKQANRLWRSDTMWLTIQISKIFVLLLEISHRDRWWRFWMWILHSRENGTSSVSQAARKRNMYSWHSLRCMWTNVNIITWKNSIFCDLHWW